jgi:Rrf2 family transcriptional regulator, nitric oxide-sensitive transcriptional repressor
MLSRTAEYALRAAICLARCDQHRATSQTLAEMTKVPEGYLSKVLNTLARAGVVTSQRGPSGGFTLAISPDDLTMLRIVEAVEPLQRITKCPLALHEHDGGLCPLHAALADLVDGIAAKLESVSIADLIREPVVPLGCSFPEREGP